MYIEKLTKQDLLNFEKSMLVSIKNIKKVQDNGLLIEFSSALPSCIYYDFHILGKHQTLSSTELWLQRMWRKFLMSTFKDYKSALFKHISRKVKQELNEIESSKH